MINRLRSYPASAFYINACCADTNKLLPFAAELHNQTYCTISFQDDLLNYSAHVVKSQKTIILKPLNKRIDD